MKINIGLFGGSGKMGKSIEQSIKDLKSNNSLVPFLFVGKEVSDLFSISVSNIKNIEESVLEDVQVWIDFTSGEGLIELLKITEKHKTPIVSGSTGLSKEQIMKVKKASKKRSLFWASNMSPGLWAFRQALKGFSPLVNFDIAIDEIHHTEKKDQPSGTAKTLQHDIEKIFNKKIDTPTSFRLGGVFGIHKVTLASSSELITLQHQALNRSVFAEGAIMASSWIVNQKVGFYTMDDMFLQKSKN